MKVITGQSHAGYKGLSTVALDNLAEANGLVHAAMGDEKFLKASFEDCMRIRGANPHYALKNTHNDSLKDQLKRALLEIEVGNAEVNATANKLCAEMVEKAKDIEPSLSLEKSYKPSEEGEVWDAGKIAADDPMAFFDPQRNAQPRSGRGDGAFRILINTDVAWYGNPAQQCAALMAVVLLLQRQAPVEIWIQQGWLGSAKQDGITLFKIFSGGVIQPQNIYFWIGSPYKDHPYSWAINRVLGRRYSGTSSAPEIPCDLYVYGYQMPNIDDSASFSKWVAGTARQMLFDEELPENWYGWKSSMDGE